MSRTHYFYFHLPVSQLEELVQSHQSLFDEFLKDNFSENELVRFENMLDSIAALYVQPILPDLSFNDFYPDETEFEKQKFFFENAQSSLCLENMPYLEGNPFQVTYLIQLLERFDEVLIDQGGVATLSLKQNYLKSLRKYKNAETFLGLTHHPINPTKKISQPLDPIDFLVLDIYKELERLGSNVQVIGQNDKIQKIFMAFKGQRVDSTELFLRSGLSPKDFDDSLERLKFWLRSL
jgi:hypothetical protein